MREKETSGRTLLGQWLEQLVMIVAEAEWGTLEEEQIWRQGLRHTNSETSATPKWPCQAGRWSLHENSRHLYLIFYHIPRSHPCMSCQ